MTPGDRIKKLREFAHMSQSDLASKLNVSTSTIGMWETNKRKITQSKLGELSIIFNVTVDYILNVEKSNNEIDIAFYNQLGELTPEQKLDVIRYADYIRSKNGI